MRGWLPWVLLALAVIATAAVYWPGVTGGWVFDDYPNILDNAAIHITWGHSTLAAWVNAALSSPASFLHRPLASITFALNWMMGDGNPYPFKVTNIVIHLINGVLLFCMLRALLRFLVVRENPDMASGGPPLVIPWLPEGQNPESMDLHQELDSGSPPRGVRNDEHGEPTPNPDRSAQSGRRIPALEESAATRLALIVSAAWLLLPINLMAVLYVVQRMESLCQMFVLAGLWAYLHGRWMMLTATNARRDRRGLALAVAGIVLGTLLGLTSKETAVLLPVFAFLAEWLVIGFDKSRVAAAHKGSNGWIPGSGDGFATASPGMTNNQGSNTDKNPGITGSSETTADASLGMTKEEDTPTPTHGEPRLVIPGLPAGQNPESSFSHQSKRIWTLFTITLFIPAVLGFLWLLRGALSPAAYSGRDFTLAQRLLTEPRVLVDYLQWTIFPNPEVLSLYHDEIVASTGLLTPWTTLGAMLLLAALIVVAVWLRKRLPLVALGIGWFFAAQLLTATIIPLELVYEQRMYFASIGVLLALGSPLLSLRWKIALPILRGFVVAVALLWFGTATFLRSQEWSNPIRLAVAEANRHPESPRAVYEAGRLLLIASNYQPGKVLDASWKYLRAAAAIQGSSALADQAMIMIADHQQHGDDAAYWSSMVRKLRDQPTRQEDISALISLTNCYGAGICRFDVAQLQRAYEAALSRPHPISRLYGAYADFQRDVLHDSAMAQEYLSRAVAGDPSEPAYRIDLAALYARDGQTEKALDQIDALRRMNLGGRLDRQIATLERLAGQGEVAPAASIH